MTPALASICADLEIQVIPTKRYRHPMETHAGETMQRLLDHHGPGHLALVLRSIAETENNKRELVAPMLWAISDTILAHPTWPATTEWLDALDSVDLAGIREIAKANRRGSALRPAINTMIYLHLRQIFDAPKQGRLL